ncbi:transmembrane protein 234 homolog [Caerostris extrusa]|uniref:Transmembrane protein 234 homolog n=1 Tax=Caerostris extrusa TaxID=172846 RepID=A0AAV4SUF8_CAEEX|nr:transmembrane protein 234 homolog [Caerostris extrusa]
MLSSIIWLIVVAAMWGFSTPLIRHGSAGIENIQKSNFLSQWFAEIGFLATNWKVRISNIFCFPFLINQSGSALYALTLGSADLTLAVPLVNSLTLIFVSISGPLLGDKDAKPASYVGMTLVAAGMTLCILDNSLK